MDRAGPTVGTGLTFAGRAAADPGREVDLAVDVAGDPLAIDPQGNALIVTPAVRWTGRSASETS